MDNKNSTQSDVHIKEKDLLHINDVIFKDSIQSAISPDSIDSSPVPKDSIVNDSVSDVSSPLTEESLMTVDENVTDAVKVSSPELRDKSFNDEDIITEEPPRFVEEDIQLEEASSVQEPHSTSSFEGIHQGHVEFFEQLEKIPNRMAFKISEVADLARVKPYVLRYWESEFEQLRPKKATNNRRMYTQKDVTTILLIKKLLYKDKYSIEGAKKALKQLQAEVRKEHKAFIQSCQQQKAIDQLKDLISDISSLKKGLFNPIEDEE